MKALVFVYGNVQGVNFRSYSVRLANELGLHGLVKNEVDGGVKLFIEGGEDAVNEFVELVKQRRSTSFFGMNVERVVVHKEGERGFKPAWRRYSGFEVDY